jgi:tRNA nucleotidyltransferase (CCA-adding enzyme)
MNLKINVPRQLIEIIDKFEQSGFEIYLVGGAIRDILMGKAVYDWDLTTNATPDEMLKLFSDAYYTNDYGMVGIPSIIESERSFEITTYRTEHGYSDFRRPDKVEWGKSLEEDLSRRDFTVNAMALRLEHKESKNPDTSNLPASSFILIDRYGGKNDLDNKLMRAVGDPNERFSEDALRMMRAIRIAAEIGFKIEENTLNAINANASLIDRISRERIHDELIKLLTSNFPADGIMLMKNSGLMDYILPELSKAFGVEQKSPERHHIYDVGTHSVMALKFVSERNKDPIVRLATLIHDIGKPQTFKKMENGVITFYNHEIVSAKIAKRIAERLRFSTKDYEKLYLLVRWHQFSVDERQTDSAIRRFIRHVGKENVSDMIDLRIGDRLGGGATETSWRLEEYIRRIAEVQKQPFSIQDLKISGFDVMKIKNIKPGPAVGKILNDLYEKVVSKELENNKEELQKALKKFKND